MWAGCPRSELPRCPRTCCSAWPAPVSSVPPTQGRRRCGAGSRLLSSTVTAATRKRLAQHLRAPGRHGAPAASCPGCVLPTPASPMPHAHPAHPPSPPQSEYSAVREACKEMGDPDAECEGWRGAAPQLRPPLLPLTGTPAAAACCPLRAGWQHPQATPPASRKPPQLSISRRAPHYPTPAALLAPLACRRAAHHVCGGAEAAPHPPLPPAPGPAEPRPLRQHPAWWAGCLGAWGAARRARAGAGAWHSAGVHRPVLRRMVSRLRPCRHGGGLGNHGRRQGGPGGLGRRPGSPAARQPLTCRSRSCRCHLSCSPAQPPQTHPLPCPLPHLIAAPL